MLAEVQLTQSELVAPSHVPQAKSQGWQRELLSAYLPTGRHEARHEPGASKNGYDAAHAMQSIAKGPEHVAHDSWQVMHVSLEDALPPEQVKPSSTAQFASQPSRLRRLPSSHPSVPTRKPSPQIETQASMAVRLPPLHW